MVCRYFRRIQCVRCVALETCFVWFVGRFCDNVMSLSMILPCPRFEGHDGRDRTVLGGTSAFMRPPPAAPPSTAEASCATLEVSVCVPVTVRRSAAVFACDWETRTAAAKKLSQLNFPDVSQTKQMCKRKRNLFATKRYAVWAQTTTVGHNEHVQAKRAQMHMQHGNLLTSPEKVSLVQRISANRSNAGLLLSIGDHTRSRPHKASP